MRTRGEKQATSRWNLRKCIHTGGRTCVDGCFIWRTQMLVTLLTDGFPPFCFLLCTHAHIHTHTISFLLSPLSIIGRIPHPHGPTHIKPTQTSGLLMLTSVASVSSECVMIYGRINSIYRVLNLSRTRGGRSRRVRLSWIWCWMRKIKIPPLRRPLLHLIVVLCFYKILSHWLHAFWGQRDAVIHSFSIFVESHRHLRSMEAFYAFWY